MDYGRIYAAFIADRRAKEPRLTGYVERHHILPRCMGGSDLPENIIKLTAEDHFFAHLLLAKRHGGKMNSALWRMLQSTNQHWGRAVYSRAAYGLAQRHVARSLSEGWIGDQNPNFNDQVFDWINYRTGAKRSARLIEMHAEFGGSRGAWTAVQTGDKPSIFGWLLAERFVAHKRSEKGMSFSFVHRDGRTFNGTQSAFRLMSGLSPAAASRICTRGAVSPTGWRLAGTADRDAYRPKDGRTSGRQGIGRIYSLRHRDGREFAGTSNEFRVFTGRPEGFKMSVRLSMLARGGMPSLYGWKLASQSEELEIAA